MGSDVCDDEGEVQVVRVELRRRLAAGQASDWLGMRCEEEEVEEEEEEDGGGEGRGVITGCQRDAAPQSLCAKPSLSV